MIFVKIHRSYRHVVAVCDSNLIGKKFEEETKEGTKQLDIRESFYKGDSVDKQQALKIIKFQAKEDATFNIVGPESIKIAKEAGIINDNSTAEIGGIPYALILR